MGVAYNTNIVTNGLKLYLDAANVKGYPGSGTTWTDISGSGLNATGTAANISSSGAIAGASWTTPSTNILDTDLHSIFFMIRLNSSVTWPTGYTGSWEKIFSFNAPGTDRAPSIWRFPSNRYLHWRYDPGNTGINIGATGTTGDSTPAVEFSLNTWYYVGVTKNGATATCYINGQAAGSGTVANPKTTGSATIIVNESYTNPLNNVNSLKVYNRVLTADEVAQNFNALRGRYGL